MKIAVNEAMLYNLSLLSERRDLKLQLKQTEVENS